MTLTAAFDGIARLPAAGDNAAIATRRLEAGTVVMGRSRPIRLPHTVLEGHRFVVEPIARGRPLLSWGLPFGTAIRDLVPGEYACNAKILRVLREREIDFALPAAANFRDHMQACTLDEAAFRPGRQVALHATPGTFAGFRRCARRGAGTRNFIILLATTAPAAGFARALAGRLREGLDRFRNIDGVVAVGHTEGGGRSRPNNLDLVLRTLAGFMVHPNTGAVLAVDYGGGAYGNQTLRAFMRAHGYPLAGVRHAFMEIDGAFEPQLERGAATVRGWLPEVDRCARTREPLSALKLALQCGGSDAFSGISGNALAGWVAKELIRHGGSANLAETDELIGAEPYVLSNVRDLETARAFLAKIARFKERASHHGTSAEGNPSGGNNYRGLYNIALKSLGAARKRDPEVRLDHVIDYAQPMSDPGYYFMDSPGNDLESIAGQVAAGANLILFITGNGSITNFPFVPTLKFVTTSGRFELLAEEMDVNAGRYNDGEPMERLGRETFALAVDVASGRRSKGELAGHAQVSIWRDWQQTDGTRLEAIRRAPAPAGRPLGVAPAPPAELRFEALRTARGFAADQVGLIMPTSLCSGQVARLIAVQLNRRANGEHAVSRYVALVHTEGCGSANTAELFLRTLLGHLEHRLVRQAVLLEHGCEQTHNDAVRRYIADHGLDAGRFGWASVQLDGGLEKVRDKVARLFGAALAGESRAPSEPVGVAELRLGLAATGALPQPMAEALALLARGVVAGGGTVVIPENAALAASDPFKASLLEDPGTWRVTLAYGERTSRGGLHVMQAPTEDPVETLSGLGASGVEVMLCHVGRTSLPAHPMIPLIQVSADRQVKQRFGDDLDYAAGGDTPPDAAARALLARIGEVASRRYTPRLFARGNTEFQLTRGPLGLSM